MLLLGLSHSYYDTPYREGTDERYMKQIEDGLQAGAKCNNWCLTYW